MNLLNSIGNKTKPKLKPWAPGVSGNPNGRPRGALSFTTKVKNALTAVGTGNGDSYEKKLIKTILHKAVNEGDNAMIKLIWEQLDGKPLQRIEADVTNKVDINVFLDGNANQGERGTIKGQVVENESSLQDSGQECEPSEIQSKSSSNYILPGSVIEESGIKSQTVRDNND